ncbi:MAG: substrate-binding domain-containing protein [Planctomycetia bacterium]|nr:substrate-binding domain-containing protein [Planctomycetia bacterium]
MSWILRVSVVLALAVVVACVPACSNKKSDKIKIGVVTNCTDPFWDLCEAGAMKAGEHYNVEVLFRQPEGMDVAKQMPIVEAFIQQGVKGLAISVIDPKGQKKDLTRIASEVPLITMDNDADADTGRLCYVGVDNKEAGRAVGRLVKKALPNGGIIAMFIGSELSANGQGRTQGVLDELATPDANGKPETRTINGQAVAGKLYGKYFLMDGAPTTDGGPEKNPQQYPHIMLGRLENVPDVCMIGLYAYNPPAILSAARSKSMVGKIKIVGFDENPVTLKAVAAGEIEGTVVQDPYNYGYKSVEVLAAVARGDKSKLLSSPLPYQVVTKDGGETQTINGLTIKFPKATDYENTVKSQFASVGK